MTRLHMKFGCTAALLIALTIPTTQARADRLETIRDRGVLICGVNTGLTGFSIANSLGVYRGLDVDYCRAVAVALFDDPEAVDFLPMTSTERFEALLAGQFDILARNTTWTLSRNTDYGEFIGVNYYDGQGFMVKRSDGIRSALELDNRLVCVSRGTTTELNAVDFFNLNQMRYRPVYFDDEAKAAEAYEAGDCTVLTTDRSGLAANRARFEEPEAHRVLPEVISKEPLGPMVPHGETTLANVARWTLNCMINAEELGLRSANVDDPLMADSPAVRRLLGLEGETGARLGLDAEWCARIVREVGNYGESYDRNVGPDTPLALERGVNRLWTDGGILYAPPIR